MCTRLNFSQSLLGSILCDIPSLASSILFSYITGHICLQVIDFFLDNVLEKLPNIPENS